MSDEESDAGRTAEDRWLERLAAEERKLNLRAEAAMRAIDSGDIAQLQQTIGCSFEEAEVAIERWRPPTADQREGWLQLWALLARHRPPEGPE